MVARIFDLPGILTVAIIAAVAFLVPVIVGAVRKESGLWRGVEAAILALLGGFAARTFISVVLGLASDSSGARVAVGLGFFLIPGIVDIVAGVFGSQPVLSTVDSLLLFAGIVGSATGMLAGIYQIYDWAGLGWLAFPLDVTWALAGNTVGALIHVINIGWGDHGEETRENVHRYASGFRLKTDFAFTQGCVMSDLKDAPGADLYRHEKTHVWQNRAFGPLFTLTYIGWMLVWLIPAVVAGIIVKGAVGIGKGLERWCYFNNPWETWAYAVQGVADRKNIGKADDDADSRLTWRPLFVILWSIPFFLVTTGLAVFTFYSIWLSPQPAPRKQDKAGQHRHAQLPANDYLYRVQQATHIHSQTA